jgi:hypothetical protein
VSPGLPASLGDLVKGGSRLEAARCFFDLLVLQSKGLAALQQHQPYGDISATLQRAGQSL